MATLGTGYLNWGRSERIVDRYGAIGLWDQNNDETVSLTNKPPERTYGKLIAKIIDTRESKHIGDLFHGFFPQTPEIGEEIILGEGRIFYEEDNRVGLKPISGREVFWLDPKKLYRAHEQLVELRFEKVDLPSQKKEYTCAICGWSYIGTDILDFNLHASTEHREVFYDPPDSANRNDKRLRDYVKVNRKL